MILVRGATIVLVAYFLFNLRSPLQPSRMFNGALPSHHYSWRRCLSAQQLGNRREIPPRLWVSFADHLNEIPFLKCYRFLIDTAVLKVSNRWRRERGEPELSVSEITGERPLQT